MRSSSPKYSPTSRGTFHEVAPDICDASHSAPSWAGWLNPRGLPRQPAASDDATSASSRGAADASVSMVGVDVDAVLGDASVDAAVREWRQRRPTCDLAVDDCDQPVIGEVGVVPVLPRGALVSRVA